jgi:hypothetical protein
VLVDGRNQTRYEWRKNRCKLSGPEPERTVAAFNSAPRFDYLHGIARSHEYPVVHERKVLFVNGEYWVIVDLMRAEDSHRYDLLFHLAPPAQGAVSLAVSHNTLSIHSLRLLLAQPLVSTVSPSIEEGFVSTSYGKKERAPIVQLTQHASDTCFFTVVYPYKSDRPTICIDGPEPDGVVEQLRDGHRATLSIAIVHNDGDQYRDDLVFIDRHVQVSRVDSNGRPLFSIRPNHDE